MQARDKTSPTTPRIFTLLDELATYGQWLNNQKNTPITSQALTGEDVTGASDNDSHEPLSTRTLPHGK